MKRAIVIGTALLLLALGAGCGGDDAQPEEPQAPPPVPRALADGTALPTQPSAFRRYRGRPVIGAKDLPGSAAELSCEADRSLSGRTMVGGAWLSTDGLSVGYAVQGSSEIYTCDAVWAGERWEKCFGKLAAAEEGVGTCERDGKPFAFMWIDVPPGPAWALVDHRSFWVAYFAAGRPLLRISGTEGIDLEDGLFKVRVAFVDERGRRLEERNIEGVVAD